MSINMYVSASQRQASSASNMCKQQIQGYEQLQKAINDFTMNSPFLTGQAYDSAKKYFSSVLYPLAQAGILLTEAVERAVKKFPETYVAEVDSGDLKQAELEVKINQVNSMLLQAENIQSNLMSLNVPDLVGMKTAQLSANSMLIHMYCDVKKKLEEKLQKLIAFNASSPHIFSEIASLQQAVNQGLAQTKTAWNASSGTFTIPSPEALSWTKGIQEKWQDYAERHEPKIEVRAEKVNKGSVGEHTHYNVYVDGVFDEDKTKELKWMFDKESFKESAHFIGDFVFINDIYKSATGKDWLSEEKSSRTEAAGMLVLSVLPTKKLENIAKELKGGNKLLKGVELTEKEEKVLKEAGLLDKVGKVENVGKASVVNNFKFGDNAENHLKNVEKVNAKRGVSGGHNLDEFRRTLAPKGVNFEDLIITNKSHPTINGVYEIEYRLPRKDITGNIAKPITYKDIYTPKTVYDPKVVSDVQMFEWGKNAMQNGTIQADGRTVIGTSSNGLKFKGFLDSEGNINNFYPTLN